MFAVLLTSMLTLELRFHGNLSAWQLFHCSGKWGGGRAEGPSDLELFTTKSPWFLSSLML